jgi:hypothetical protein
VSSNQLDLGAPIAEFSTKVVALPSENPVVLNTTNTTNSNSNTGGDSGSGAVIIIAIVIGIVVTIAFTLFVVKMVKNR